MLDTHKILEENAGDAYAPKNKKENALLFALLLEHQGAQLEIMETTDEFNNITEVELVANGDAIIRAYND